MPEQPEENQPNQNQPPTAANLSATNLAATKRRSKAFGTFLLAVALSVVLIALAAAYLILAPDPDARNREAVQAAAEANAAGAADPNVLRLVAPRSVIEPDLLRDFEAENNIKVDLVLYDDEETLLAVSAAAPLNGDVLLASGTTIQWLRAQDRIGVLPARQIGNLGQIDPALRTLAASYDKEGLRAVPFAWTAFGLGLNREAVAAKLGATVATDTWGLLFDPARAAKLGECGIHSITAPSVAFPIALTYIGLAPKSDAPADTERASALWEAVRPYTAKLDTRTVGEGLASGQACVALAAASDVYQARAVARDTGQPFTVQFVIPREGSIMRLYLLALPRASQKAARGAALINYLLRPEVSARMTNGRWLANAVPASQLYVRQEIKDDPGIYPDVGAFARLTPDANPSLATISLRERFWLLMSSGTKAP